MVVFLSIRDKARGLCLLLPHTLKSWPSVGWQLWRRARVLGCLECVLWGGVWAQEEEKCVHVLVKILFSPAQNNGLLFTRRPGGPWTQAISGASASFRCSVVGTLGLLVHRAEGRPTRTPGSQTQRDKHE